MDNTFRRFERLPIRHAIPFLYSKGLGAEGAFANSAPAPNDKRARIVLALQQNNLLDEFIEKKWPFAREPEGQKRLNGYLRMAGSITEGEESYESEGDDDSKFAYEEDLRDFLANNLGIIESGVVIKI